MVEELAAKDRVNRCMLSFSWRVSAFVRLRDRVSPVPAEAAGLTAAARFPGPRSAGFCTDVLCGAKSFDLQDGFRFKRYVVLGNPGNHAV